METTYGQARSMLQKDEKVKQGRRKGYLRTGKVFLSPIRRESDWLTSDHDSLFMNDGAKMEIPAPRQENGGLIVDPLGDVTDEQKDALAKELGLSGYADFNIHKPDSDNYWVENAITIDKNGLYLDLSKPYDFIQYKIAEVNTGIFAPSHEERYESGEYTFAIIFPDEEERMKIGKGDIKKDAYIYFGEKLSGSIRKMNNFLWVYHMLNPRSVKPNPIPTESYLRAEIYKIIEEEPGVFMSILTDQHYDTKALIYRSVVIGQILKRDNSFSFFGETGNSYTLDEMIRHLEDPANQSDKLRLIKYVEDSDKAIARPTVESSGIPNPGKERDEEKAKKEADEQMERDMDKMRDDIINQVKPQIESVQEKNKELSEENEKLAKANKVLADQLSSLNQGKPIESIKEYNESSLLEDGPEVVNKEDLSESNPTDTGSSDRDVKPEEKKKPGRPPKK